MYKRQAGSRVEISDLKKNPMDFVLWKPSNEKDPGWESPWGRGRPGWHLECSAMSEKYLGKNLDIHGGGLDLIFPHHENEIAQSCCNNNTKNFANYWVHNGFVTINQEKMSKSLGNIISITDAVKKYSSKLKSDALLIFDGPKHPSNLPTLTFGARGISDITLITYGPIVPQHSGHFGNYAPNPVFRMSEILSSMKAVSYTHLRAHETKANSVCRLVL